MSTSSFATAVARDFATPGSPSRALTVSNALVLLAFALTFLATSAGGTPTAAATWSTRAGVSTSSANVSPIVGATSDTVDSYIAGCRLATKNATTAARTAQISPIPAAVVACLRFSLLGKRGLLRFRPIGCASADQFTIDLAAADAENPSHD